MKLEENKELIEQLVPHLEDSDFDDIFAGMTEHLSKSNRFLLKMEVRRLAAPCQRAIDLRGKVDAECFEYSHGDLLHYLDDDAQATFESTTALYNGYSVGVFEAVTNAQNSYRVKQQQQAEQRLNEQLKKQQAGNHATAEPLATDTAKIGHPAREVSLTNFFSRQEERLLLGLTLKIRLGNGRTVHCHSLNVSVNGLKIKLPERYEIDDDDIIGVHFMSLAQEYGESGIKRELNYRVVKRVVNGENLLVSLCKVHRDPDFEEFMSGYLAQELPKSKVDCEHLLAAIESTGYQFLHFNKLNGLPVFFSRREQQFRTEIAMYNHNNKPILEYWEGQSKLQRIACLFSQQRLETLLNQQQTPAMLTLYTFTHVARGKRFFYSATREELAEQQLTELFFAFGANKESWRVYQFYFMPLQGDHWQYHSVLPAHLDKSELLTDSQSEQLGNLSHLGYLLDITDEAARQRYRQYSMNGQQPNVLHRFGHTAEAPQGLQLVALDNFQRRREDRFPYQTPAVINNGSTAINGFTEDFSVHGLQLRLSSPYKGKRESLISLSLPGLQKVARQQNLMEIPYRIQQISKDGTVLNLAAHQPDGEHQGMLFFQKLIKANSDKLSTQLTPPEALSRSLNQLLAHHLFTLPAFIGRRNFRLVIDSLARPRGHSRLLNLFDALSDESGSFDTSPLSSPSQFKVLIGEPLRTMDSDSQPHCTVVLLQLSLDANNDYQCVSKRMDEFADEEQVIQFVRTAHRQGQFYGVQVMLNSSERISSRGLSGEALYAARQSIHRARRLQDDMDEIFAIAELVDISDEVMHSLGIEAD